MLIVHKNSKEIVISTCATVIIQRTSKAVLKRHTGFCDEPTYSHAFRGHMSGNLGPLKFIAEYVHVD